VWGGLSIFTSEIKAVFNGIQERSAFSDAKKRCCFEHASNSFMGLTLGWYAKILLKT
jgi:hypothetical protein